MFVNKYPYTDMHELNLDWLLAQMLQLRTDMKNFINQNVIKYADPIQWNITTQYEANTVVIEPNSGNAYISSQPVPAGVAISNTDYWSVIGNFSVLYESIKESIAAADDGSNINATEARTEGQLLWLNSKLYKVLSDISVGALYITSGTGQNLQEVTIEDLLNNIESKAIKYFDTVSDMISADLQEGELVKVKGYYTVNDQGGAFYTISSLSDGFSQVLDNGLYANILIEDIMCPEQFGAYGDGLHDDAAAFNKAVQYAGHIEANQIYRFVSPSEYNVTQIFVKIPSDRIINGSGTITLAANDYAGYVILGALAIDEDISNITIEGLTIIGDKTTHTGTTGQWGFGVGIFGTHDINIRGCKISNCWGDGIYIGRWDNGETIPENIFIENNVISSNRRNNISIVSGHNIIIDGNVISDASGQSPQAGIDIEPDPGTVDDIEHVIINDNIIDGNTALGVQVLVTKVTAGVADVRDIVINDNIFSGNTATPVKLLNGTNTYKREYTISNNKFNRTPTGIEVRKLGVSIIGNEFNRVSGSDYIIYCPNVLSGEFVLSDNIFDNCIANDSIVYVYDGSLYASGNKFIYPVAPTTINFNDNSNISNNLFSGYYSVRETEIIKYTGISGVMCLSGNSVIRRGSVAVLAFLKCTQTFSAGNATIANNIHVGASFTTLSGYGGGNNYLNGVLVS